LNSRSKQKPDYVLDFRGAISSITLLKMSDIFKEMKTNQILELLVHDKDTMDDIFKILPKSSYIKKVINEGSFNRISVKKITEES